jgi:hypothetical protein
MPHNAADPQKSSVVLIGLDADGATPIGGFSTLAPKRDPACILLCPKIFGLNVFWVGKELVGEKEFPLS